MITATVTSISPKHGEMVIAYVTVVLRGVSGSLGLPGSQSTWYWGD